MNGKMKHWIILILFIIICTGLNAQQDIEMPQDSPFYSRALELILNRDYEKARTILHQGLAFATGEMRMKSIQKIGLSWYFEGCILKLENKNKEAYPCFINARRYFQEISDKEDEMSVLKQMAEIQKRLYSPDESMARYSEVVEIAKQIPDTLMWIDALKGQGGLLRELGQWEEYVQLSLRLDSLMLNVRDVKVQMELNYERGDNAQLLWGNYPIAESFYLKNLELIPDLEENIRNSQSFITSLRLCDLKIEQKKYEDALKYNAQCLSCYASEYPNTTSSNRYSPYRNRAYIYQKMGRREEAFSCMDSLFQGHQFKSISAETMASHYMQRGVLHTHFGEYNQAIVDYRYADSLLAVRYPENTESRMRVLLATANCWYYKKEYTVAEGYYSRYAALCNLKYGEESMEYANALCYLANIEGFACKKQSGWQNYSKAAILLKDLIKKQLRYLPANSRDKYWNDLSDMLWDMTAYAIKTGAMQEAFTQDAYDALVFSKGLLLESEKSMRDLLHKNGTQEDLALYNKMILLRSRLTEMEHASRSTENVDNLYSQIDQIDKQLSGKCSFYGNYTRFLDTQYTNIQSALKEGEVAIDFVDLKLDSTHCYAAYILRKEWKYPLLVSLFKQEQLDSLYSAVSNLSDRLYQYPYSKSLLDLCWKPFLSHIRPDETVYYVPSGSLHQLSLESIAITSDSILADKFRFVRLSSTREICKKRFLTTTYKCAALYGGLYYDVDLPTMHAESKKYDISRLFALRGTPTSGDSIYRYLPMTREEVNCIASLLGDCQIDTSVYEGSSGTEESFFHLDGQAPHIIHLATHGFYYTPTDAENVSRLAGYRNAMLLSGLIMSGGNAGWKGETLPAGVLDGIMTADNISCLNLRGADLVVLSACETGVGNVNSEGVFGLQRAFKKAGVQTLIMTLLGVSDCTTKEFMVHFYKSLTKNGWDKRKAFEDAKRLIRQTYPEPFYWAGFIMLD